MEKTFSIDLKKDSRNKSNSEYKTFYAKSELIKSNRYKHEKNKSLYSLNKNKYKKEYKYGKLFNYSKEKLFLNDIKKYKDNNKRINLNKINKFYQLCICNKIRTFSESHEYNEITQNNKTTTISDTTSNNFSNNIKSINLFHCNNNDRKTRNKSGFYFDKNIKSESNIKYISKSDAYNGFSIFKSNQIKKNKNLAIISPLTKENKKLIQSLYKHENKKEDNSYLASKPLAKVLNYKFNDVIGNLNNNVYFEGKLTSTRGQIKGLTEQILTKFKFNIINDIKKEFLITQYEIQQNPLNVIKEYEVFQELNKKYYNIYQNLIKKYFGYLYSQIDEEKYKLLVIIKIK